MNKIENELTNLLFIKNLLNNKSNNVINFVSFGNTEKQELEKLKKALIKEKFDKDIRIASYKDEIVEYSNYLILKLGSINYSDVFILNKRIDLIENQLMD